ncbi:MAG: division plane positioning ATPase MipZ [Pseudomonadota bacterium]
MHVIVTMSAKGGVGKSTLARGLISAAAHKGLRTGFVETDRSRATYLWARDAHAAGYWDTGIQGYAAGSVETLEATIVALDAAAEQDGGVGDDATPPLDLLVVDTAGDRSPMQEFLLGGADLVLVPINLTRIAMLTSLETASHIYTVIRDNPDAHVAKLRGVVNQRPRELTEILQTVRTYLAAPDLLTDENGANATAFPLLELEIRERNAYREMESKGLLHKIVEAYDAPRLRLRQKHFADALAEMEALLEACLAEIERANA